MLASPFIPGPLPSLPLCQQNQEVTKVLWMTPGDTCLQLLYSASLSPRNMSLADYLYKSTMTPESSLTQDRCAAAGSGWQGQDGRVPQTESLWVLNAHLWEKVPFKIPPWAASWSQRLANIGSSALRSTPCTPSHIHPCAFLWRPELVSLSLQPLVARGEQWDILHAQGNGVWRRSPMNTGHNCWGRRAEAFLQGWIQEGQAGDDWLLIQMPGPRLTASC